MSNTSIVNNCIILHKCNVIFQSELYICTGQNDLFCNSFKMFYISRQHGIMRSPSQNQVGQLPEAYSFKIIKHAIDLVWNSSLRASIVLFVMERRYLGQKISYKLIYGKFFSDLVLGAQKKEKKAFRMTIFR